LKTLKGAQEDSEVLPQWRQNESLHEQYVVDAEGKKTGVILPVARYEQLLEDLHDLAAVAERRGEASISLEEMERRLKAYGPYDGEQNAHTGRRFGGASK
jgi:PHD/YefM family antitoxin component YafN of YafNO toxin-antitoxin module